MIYYIEYIHWIIIFSICICVVFMLNLQNKRITGFLLLLSILGMFVPRILPLDYLRVISEEKSVHTLNQIGSEGIVIDNMVSFKDTNYYINEDLKDSGLEPGFYDKVGVIQTRKFIETDVFKLKFHIDTYYKDVYIEDINEDSKDEEVVEDSTE